MDVNNEAMTGAANTSASRAYSALYAADAEDIHSIVHGFYRNSSTRCEKAVVEASNEAPT